MSRFTHDWTESDFRLLSSPRGSTDIVVAPDAAAQPDGDDGTPGDHDTPPGNGANATGGGGGGNAAVDGTKLKFSHANPLATWLESGTGGSGGDGGNGGDAGTIPRHHADYGTAWASGSSGGFGGGGGNSLVTLDSAAIYGRTGTASGDGIDFTMVGIGGNGGRGGDGGHGDGGRNSPYQGGDGGNGSSGGGGGNVFVDLNNTTFARVNNASDPNHLVIAVTQTATGANGGHGGDGGKAGLGVPAGTDGAGGNGGGGGEASTEIQNTTFSLAHGGGGTSLLTIVMTSHGGNGGDGGDDGRPNLSNGGMGGQGGSAAITFANNLIAGGNENDTVRLAFTSIAGKGGVSGDGTVHTVNGGGGAELNLCDFEGGGGHNTILFSWAGHATNLAVTVDLNNSTVGMGGGVCTLNGFQDITGGSSDDFLTGNDISNKLNGAGGDDSLRGMADADTLTGGAGHDHFVFEDADESSGPTYDTITDLNFNQDSIGVDFDVAHVDAAIGGATISKGSFDADIDAAVGNLRAFHAVVVTATHGTLHDHTFLVIEAEGVRGYQPGHDIVIDITGVTGTMTVHDFFNAH